MDHELNHLRGDLVPLTFPQGIPFISGLMSSVAEYKPERR